MLIDILNVDEAIREYGWKEVKVANYFTPNTSENHPDGLVSNEIFGNPGTIERKTKWGYVELGDIFMNPHVFYVMQRLKSGIASDMKQGLGRYYIDKNGELVKLPNGKSVPADAIVKETGTGFRWLRDNWENISWRVTKDMSKTAKDRRQLLQSISAEEAFIERYPIMPAFYRDVDFKTQKRNKINSEFYSPMIHLANLIKKSDMFFINDDDPNIPNASISHIKMQDLIMKIYLFFMNKCSGANGFINDYVVGKATDYGARLVISCPNINTERYTDCECDFYHSSTPLSIAINIFAPYMVYGITSWLTNYVAGRIKVPYFNEKTNRIDEIELDPTFMDEFDVQKIRRIMNRYKKSKFFRTEKITLRGINGERVPINYFYKDINEKIVHVSIGNVGDIDITENDVKHGSLSYCEWFTIIANKYIKDKYIFNTRYPVIDYNGTYPSLMNIIPSNKYVPKYINGEYIQRYPVIPDNISAEEAEHLFTDTMRMFSVYPAALGADFDGDQISSQSVLSEEGTDDCNRHIREISNVVGLNGSLIREFPHVVEHGLYGLTYKIPIPEDQKGGE